MRLSIRKKGMGSISRERNGRYRVNAPVTDGVQSFLGYVDSYRDGERAINAWFIARALVSLCEAGQMRAAS